MRPARWQLDADIHFEADDFPAACRKIAAHFREVARAYERAGGEVPCPSAWYHGRMLLRLFEDKRWRILRDGAL